MSNHEIDHADDLSARVLHSRAEGGGGRLPSPCRTLAVGPGDTVRTARVADGDEVCIANRSGGPIGVFAEPDPAMLADWAEALIREHDALAARVAEVERERDVAIRELSATAARLGRIEGVLTAVADRLEYLQSLWGAEAITDRTAKLIRECLAEAGDAAKGGE